MAGKPPKPDPRRVPVAKLIDEKFGSATAFARRIKTDQQKVSQFLTGETEQPRNLDDYAEALGVTRAWLLSKDPDRQPPGHSEPRYAKMGKALEEINSVETIAAENGHANAGKTPRKDSPEMSDLKLGLIDDINEMDTPNLERVKRFIQGLQKALTTDLDRPPRRGKKA